MGKSKPPAPPDPAETAGAQTAQNIGTAIAQSTLNNTNQVTPDGSLTYTQTGSSSFTDPNTGRVYEIPQYTATQTLSDSQQAIKDQSDAAGLNFATLANEQSGRLGELLGKPVDINNESVEARLMELGRSRLDPALDRRREQLRTSLSNQGIKEGSEAFDRAMMRNSEGENDAYNQLLLTGRGQAVQEALAERNQPINEISALMSGSQVSQPNFVGTNPAKIANVDRAGLENAAYQGQLAAWQQGNNNFNSVMGGLFGLGSAGIIASDMRVKENVEQIDTRDDGLGVYRFDYIDGPKDQVGLMAQEVEQVYPLAVLEIGGVKHINYGLVP